MNNLDRCWVSHSFLVLFYARTWRVKNSAVRENTPLLYTASAKYRLVIITAFQEHYRRAGNSETQPIHFAGIRRLKWNKFVLNPLETKNSTLFYAQCCTISKKRALLFLKVPLLRPFGLLIRVIIRWEWVQSIGGMIKAGETRSTSRRTCLSQSYAISQNLPMERSGANTKLPWSVAGEKPPEPCHDPKYI